MMLDHYEAVKEVGRQVVVFARVNVNNKPLTAHSLRSLSLGGGRDFKWDNWSN